MSDVLLAEVVSNGLSLGSAQIGNASFLREDQWRMLLSQTEQGLLLEATVGGSAVKIGLLPDAHLTVQPDLLTFTDPTFSQVGAWTLYSVTMHEQGVMSLNQRHRLLRSLLMLIEPGDLTADGAVDINDITPFMAALMSQNDRAAFSAELPDAYFDAADFNLDGLVNESDRLAFITDLDARGITGEIVQQLRGLTEFSNMIDGDANGDGMITGADLIAVQRHFGDMGPSLSNMPGDANHDGMVTGADLIAFLMAFNGPGTSDHALPGDANGDGLVTGADLIALQQHFGETGPTTGLPGDANGDGMVTGADLITLQRNFGQTLSASDPAVPEPGALMAWLMVLAGFLKRPRFLR